MTQRDRPFFEQQTLFAPGRRGPYETRYRGRSMVVSPKGTIFAFPSEKLGGIADESKGAWVQRRSFDCGRTWTHLEVLAYDENPRVRHGVTSVVADDRSGRVIAIAGTGVVILRKDIGGEWPEKWRHENPREAEDLARKLAPDATSGRYVTWTEDEGETWSPPLPLAPLTRPNPVTGEQRRFGPQWSGIQLCRGPHAGRLVLPGRGRTQDRPHDLFAYSHNCVICSDDGGRTWRVGGLAQTGTGEACVVEQADGTVYLNSRNESLRCRGYRAWDRSHDGGETFVESGYDPALPEPHCQASMVRYSWPEEDRSRVLFCNPAVHSETPTHYDAAGRRKLTVRISYDECRTWPISREVCPGGAGYSALAVAPDGTILCMFETLDTEGPGSEYTGSVELARFSLAWLLDGRAEPA